MRQIPEVMDPERYGEYQFINSDFIEVKSNDLLEISMQYPMMNMQNAEEKCYVREEVYHKLIRAAKKLPSGYKFKILDGWRPFALQEELYDVYSVDIIRDFELENLEERERQLVICRFISDPIKDEYVPPVHTTGGAVDVTILDASGKELDMGTRFDAFTKKTYTAYYETQKDYVIRDNRRLLYYTMMEEGFTNLPSEWWHYDYGDRFWAFYNKRPALYKGVFTKGELNGR